MYSLIDSVHSSSPFDLSEFKTRKKTKKGLCPTKINSVSCISEYSGFNYERNHFGLGWSALNSPATSLVQQAFTYTKASSIESSPYTGVYANYLGGGYVYLLYANTSVAQIQSDLAELKVNNWIDKQTSALFIEFSLFNANKNLFAYCTILFEILPTGNILISHEFDPISLYADEAPVNIFLDILYLFATVIFIVEQVLLIIKLKKQYVKHFWPYVTLSLVIFSWVSFAMYMYRVFEKYILLNKISKNTGQVINFQSLSHWNNAMIICLSACCFLGSIKLFEILNFSRTIQLLIKVFLKCFQELCGLMLIFTFILFAYINLSYLILMENNAQFSTISRSISTTFLIIIGKFNSKSFYTPLGSVMFISFHVALIFVLLNLFISTLCNNFSQIRADYKTKHNNEDSVIFNYFKNKITPKMLAMFGFKSSNYKLDRENVIKTKFQFHDSQDQLILLEKRCRTIIQLLYEQYQFREEFLAKT